MKHFTLLLFVAAITIFSCNQSQTKTEVMDPADSPVSVENKVMIPSTNCYSSVKDKDTFKLKVEVFPNVVTGKLSYQFFDKDRNSGDIEGKMKGDTLLADYKFMSEGKLSTRQVIFLIKDSVATEGYGDMEEKEGKMVFKNNNDINFGKGLILKMGDCGEY